MSLSRDKRFAAGIAGLALLVAACTTSHTAVVPSASIAASQTAPRHLAPANDCSSTTTDEDPAPCLPDIPVTAVYIPPPEIIPYGIPISFGTAQPIQPPSAPPTLSPECQVRLAMLNLAKGDARTNMLHVTQVKGAESGYFIYVDDQGNVHLSSIMIGGTDGIGISPQTIIDTLNSIPGGASRVIGWVHSHDTPYYRQLAGSNPSLENPPSSLPRGKDYVGFEWMVQSLHVPAGATTMVMGLDGLVRAYVPDGKGGWKQTGPLTCFSGGAGSTPQ